MRRALFSLQRPGWSAPFVLKRRWPVLWGGHFIVVKQAVSCHAEEHSAAKVVPLVVQTLRRAPPDLLLRMRSSTSRGSCILTCTLSIYWSPSCRRHGTPPIISSTLDVHHSSASFLANGSCRRPSGAHGVLARGCLDTEERGLLPQAGQLRTRSPSPTGASQGPALPTTATWGARPISSPVHMTPQYPHMPLDCNPPPRRRRCLHFDCAQRDARTSPRAPRGLRSPAHCQTSRRCGFGHTRPPA